MKPAILVLSLPVLLGINPQSGAQEVRQRAVFRGQHTLWFRPMLISPDGKLLASCGADPKGADVKLWDLSTGAERGTLTGHMNAIAAMAFSADGKLLTTGEQYDTLKVWDVDALKQVVAFTGNRDDSLQALALQGTQLAAAGNREVQVSDMATGKVISGFKRKISAYEMTFSHDLRTLASPNYEDLDLWDVPTGKLRRILADHRGAVRVSAFTPDDKLLVATSMRTEGKTALVGEIRIWDVATGRERVTLKEGIGWVLALAVSPEGKT